MRHSIAKDLYKNKYQSELSLDEYYSYLKAGLDLLKQNDAARDQDTRIIKAINIALDYKLRILLSGITGTKGIYDSEFYDLGI
jgi:hypothetical protein